MTASDALLFAGIAVVAAHMAWMTAPDALLFAGIAVVAAHMAWMPVLGGGGASAEACVDHIRRPWWRIDLGTGLAWLGVPVVRSGTGSFAMSVGPGFGLVVQLILQLVARARWRVTDIDPAGADPERLLRRLASALPRRLLPIVPAHGIVVVDTAATPAAGDRHTHPAVGEPLGSRPRGPTGRAAHERRARRSSSIAPHRSAVELGRRQGMLALAALVADDLDGVAEVGEGHAVASLADGLHPGLDAERLQIGT